MAMERNATRRGATSARRKASRGARAAGTNCLFSMSNRTSSTLPASLSREAHLCEVCMIFGRNALFPQQLDLLRLDLLQLVGVLRVLDLDRASLLVLDRALEPLGLLLFVGLRSCVRCLPICCLLFPTSPLFFSLVCSLSSSLLFTFPLLSLMLSLSQPKPTASWI